MMEAKEIIKWQLEASRQFLLRLCDGLTDDECYTRIGKKGNHVIWILGHIGWSESGLLGMTGKEGSQLKEGYSELFGIGSEPKDDRSIYPPRNELLDCLNEIRQQTLAHLNELSSADLDKEVSGGPDFVNNIGETFGLIALHEMSHGGQISAIRRLLGKPPTV